MADEQENYNIITHVKQDEIKLTTTSIILLHYLLASSMLRMRLTETITDMVFHATDLS